jgi:hypothetical protein
MRRAALIFTAMVTAALEAAAQPADAPRRIPFTPGPPVSLPPCTCRAEGRSWLVGDSICLKTPNGERLAICTTDENVTTWRISPVPCATSSLSFSRSARLTQRNPH